jgi:hypothetical protein
MSILAHNSSKETASLPSPIVVGVVEGEGEGEDEVVVLVLAAHEMVMVSE